MVRQICFTFSYLAAVLTVPDSSLQQICLTRSYLNPSHSHNNARGWMPLHMACYSARSSVVTVRKLLAVHPAACSVRDEQHLVPLHRACLMASDDVLEIVRALLLADPSQVNVEIRNGERDVPFHLLVARIHHEIQKERFQPLRMQKDYGFAKSSRWNSNASASSISSSSSDNDEPGEEVANRNTWPFHEPHPILEQLIEATFLILEAEERGSIGNGYLTKHRMVELVNGCLRNCRCPNQRLFAYMALWDHPELATMSMKNTDTCGVIGESDGSEITTSSSVSRSTSGIMLHVAAGHAKHSINDCHWCAACNRGLADPHFVSQDSGESCDLTCAYKKGSIDNTEETGNAATEDNNNNTGRARRRSSWYQRYKDRMYKDVVLTIPYGCILKQIANLYPQAAETRTDDGTLPLHLAILNGHTWIPGIQAIYRSYPAAGSVRDASTGLYPYQLAAAKKPQPEDDGEWDRKRYLSELTTSFELLRADPDVILKN